VRQPRIFVSNAIKDFIKSLPPSIKKKLKQAFIEISKDPDIGKHLIEDLDKYYSYRIGRIRIIYDMQKSIPTIQAIGPRKTIYRDFAIQITKSKRHIN
jgi:mRNA-degrading endonuclease RelE of RelBE toxin-antitoxin system